MANPQLLFKIVYTYSMYKEFIKKSTLHQCSYMLSNLVYCLFQATFGTFCMITVSWIDFGGFSQSRFEYTDISKA